MSKILIDLVELETALNKTETDAEMSGKNHAFVKGIRAAKKIALACKDTEIVRCKDCQYCFVEGFVNPHNVCEKHPEIINPPDDWFCTDGWK